MCKQKENNTYTLKTLAGVKSAGFRPQLELSRVSSHTEEL